MTEAEVRDVCARFVGEIRQVPPAFSALKVNGKRSYDLAREGKPVQLEARRITVYELTVLNVALPEVRFRVRCSKGSYIRSLCRDIGIGLGCGACMSGLLRTRVGAFGLGESRTLGQLQELKEAGRLEEAVIAPDALFADLPRRTVIPACEKLLLNGNKLPEEAFDTADNTGPAGDSSDRLTRIYLPDGTFRALYRYDAEAHVWRAKKMF